MKAFPYDTGFWNHRGNLLSPVSQAWGKRVEGSSSHFSEALSGAGWGSLHRPCVLQNSSHDSLRCLPNGLETHSDLDRTRLAAAVIAACLASASSTWYLLLLDFGIKGEVADGLLPPQPPLF